MKKALVVAFALALTAGVAYANFCARDEVPAATLLFPFSTASVALQSANYPSPPARQLRFDFSPAGNALGMSFHLPGTAAVLLADPAGQEVYVLVQAQKEFSGPLLLSKYLQPKARLVLNRADLGEGEVTVVLPQRVDLTRVKIVLLGFAGEAEEFEADGLSATKTLTLVWTAQGCPTIELTCSNGCKTSTTCCSPRFCADCVDCEIKCGSLCNLP